MRQKSRGPVSPEVVGEYLQAVHILPELWGEILFTEGKPSVGAKEELQPSLFA